MKLRRGRAVPAMRDLDNRAAIELMVRNFYRDAATDDLLGPIFAGMHVDWPAHIAKLTDFWSFLVLRERGYTGQPLRAHEPVHERFPFAQAHYERWLELFVDTVDDSFRGPGAELAKQRAAKMVNALQRLIEGEDVRCPKRVMESIPTVGA